MHLEISYKHTQPDTIFLSLLTLTRGSGSLADLFEVMEAAAQPCGLAAYALSQCTLEHVFVRLAMGKGSSEDRSAVQ